MVIEIELVQVTQNLWQYVSWSRDFWQNIDMTLELYSDVILNFFTDWNNFLK